MTRGKLVAAASYAGVFLLGAATGGAAIHAQSVRSDASIFDDQAGARHRMFVWSLDKKLDLTTPQRQRIEEILAAHDPECDAISAPIEPRLKELRARIRAEIRQALTPAQQPEFDELMRRQDEGRARRREATAAP